MTWQGRTIGSALRDTVERRPDKIAVIGMGQRLTFAELNRMVDTFAEGLIDLGIRRGDHVALWMTNCPSWVMVWIAASRIGAVLVPINTRFKRDEAQYILRQSDAKALIAMDEYWSIDFLAMIGEMIPGMAEMTPGSLRSPHLPELRSVILWGDEARPGAFSIADVMGRGRSKNALAAVEKETRADDPVIIVYTSGTTGHPKGAVHGHVVLRNAANVARVMHIEEGDIILGHMPFYHVAGAFTAILPTLMLGCTLVTMPHWVADEGLDLIEKERITIFGGIPTHFIDCLDALRRRPRDMSSLKSAWIGGAPVTPDVARATLSDMKLRSLQAVYGMTETTAATVFSEADAPLEILCDNKGRPIGEFEVRVCDPETGQPRPTGEPGEIWVRGHIVMQSYYKNPQATAEVMTPDGWFKTGDLGVFDEQNYLKITGRVKDMFIVGGSNTYPAEIERILQARPAVKQAVVVGVPDRRLGEVGYAFVELHEGADETIAGLSAYCKGAMADYKVPRYIEFVSEFPRTTTGKLQRFVLDERARAGLAKSAAS